jgi:hypothetical protein
VGSSLDDSWYRRALLGSQNPSTSFGIGSTTRSGIRLIAAHWRSGFTEKAGQA